MISETLPQLIEENKVINRNSLFETYLMTEIKRQKIEKKRELLIDAPKRLQLMRLMAFELFNKKNSEGLISSEVLELVRGHLTPEQMLQLEGHISDFLTCSFLKRDGSKFSFSHQTIMEFLVSEVLYEEISKGNSSYFEKLELTEPMLDLLSEKEINNATIWKWVTLTRKITSIPETFLGSNAISLLNKLGYNLAGSDLSMTDIHGAKLERVDLSKANLESANCRGIFLSESNLNEACLESANLDFADLSRSSLSGASLSKASIEQANLNDTDLQGADLSVANMVYSSLEEADLEGADLSGCDLTGVNLRKANLVRANLSGANLEEADLSEADLSNADIRDTNLYSILEGTKLYGTIFNDSTTIDWKRLGCNINEALNQGYIDKALHEFLKPYIKLNIIRERETENDEYSYSNDEDEYKEENEDRSNGL